MTDKQAKPSPSGQQDQRKEHPEQEIHTPELSNLTPDSQSVQGQETSLDPKRSPTEDLAPDSVEMTVKKSLADQHDEQVCDKLMAFNKNLNNLLYWKEELKLLSLGANINLSYYDLWRGDSNELFRRCAILRKRLKKYQNHKKGA